MKSTSLRFMNRRRVIQGVGAGAALGMLGEPLSRRSAAAQDANVRFGVSAPLTGDTAEYGRIWQQAMGIAVDEINAAGGIAGRTLELVWEDTQADPKQSVPVAQKFVNDPTILAELGDFASSASMAASPIYERGKLVQFGFTNSHPDFTKGGEYMFSTALSAAQDSANLARVAFEAYGGDQAVLYRNTDWGKSSDEFYIQALQELGGSASVSDGYLEDEKDFRPLLAKVNAAAPKVLTLFSYYTDGALLASQAKAVGLAAPIVISGASNSPEFLELGGDAVEGIITTTEFFAADVRPEAEPFVKEYTAKFGQAPDTFAAGAYDAVKILAWAAENGEFSRDGIQNAMATGTDIPSIMYGPFKFGPDRRIENVQLETLIIKNGEFVPYEF